MLYPCACWGLMNLAAYSAMRRNRRFSRQRVGGWKANICLCTHASIEIVPAEYC
jgi:hypothetical protein